VSRGAKSSQKQASRGGSKHESSGVAAGIGEKARQLVSSIASSKKASAIVIVVVVLLLVGAFDAIANGGKAYDNVTINGVKVGGMNKEQMRSTLEESFGARTNATQVTLESADAEKESANDSEKEASDERDLLAELVVAEYSEDATSWVATADSLKATYPYDEAIDKALEAGRGAGPFSRLGLMITGADIPMKVQFNEKAFESLAENIDKSLGNTRVDSTAIIEDGEARVLPGRNGKMVDRTWLNNTLEEAFMAGKENEVIPVSAVDAPSRTTVEQAQTVCDAINRAIDYSANFKYHESSWQVSGEDIANWTRVDVVPNGDSYALKVSLDSSVAAPEITKGLGATVKSEGVTVSFEVDGEDIIVKTNGSGTVPEIDSAIRNLEDQLYGSDGSAWKQQPGTTLQVDVSETDAPESLTFDEALSLGIITVIGEYETQFSNDAGTENRNHNIRLCAELLNNTVAKANGGEWSFNDHSGDTNQDPPFATAGSIVQGEYVDSVGGGVCQVATTIFNAVYEAGLPIDMRFNHSLYIASYPDGRDASVSYPDLDFVWSNSLESDVLLKTDSTETTVTAKLYGVYTGYRVETEVSDWTEGAKYSTSFETDEALQPGMYYLKKNGQDGRTISVTRSVYDKDGTPIEVRVFPSNYQAQNEVYVVGPGTDTSGLVRSN